MPHYNLPHNHGQNMERVLNKMPHTEDFTDIAFLFQQLGDPTRLRILWLLCHCDECVCNIAAAVDRLSEYHFDGLRMDAISRIIYWMGYESRGVNDRAVDFIRNMNQGLKDRHPSIILCAEDSTDFKGTTKETKYGGLGFDYKWDMGWMNDTLNFFRTLPFVRGEHYHDLTFSMMYNYNERYLLPLSHDEVVH